jgi:hypothetical protein
LFNLIEKGIIMNITDDEALGFMDRLLEWLRQADLTNFGSRIEVVYVAPGAQHVDKQYIASPPSPLQKARGVDSSEMSKSLPDELATDEAMALWRKAQQAGYVNEHYQPQLSRTQAALLADAMAERLGIKEKWKVFETLWHRRNMHKDYYLAFGQQQTSDFQDEIKALFG